MIWIMLATLAVVFVVNSVLTFRARRRFAHLQRSAEHRCRTRGVDSKSNGKVSW